MELQGVFQYRGAEQFPVKYKKLKIFIHLSFVLLLEGMNLEQVCGKAFGSAELCCNQTSAPSLVTIILGQNVLGFFEYL